MAADAHRYAKIMIVVDLLGYIAIELKVSVHNSSMMPEVHMAQAIYNKIIDGF